LTPSACWSLRPSFSSLTPIVAAPGRPAAISRANVGPVRTAIGVCGSSSAQTVERSFPVSSSIPFEQMTSVLP